MGNTRPKTSTRKKGSRPAREIATGYTLLRETSRLISSTPDIVVLLELLYEEIRKLIPADTYFVILYDETSDEASVEVLIDEGERFPRTRQRLVAGLTKWVIDNHKPMLVRDMEKDALPVEPVYMGKQKMSRSWLGVPMLLGDRVTGVLVAASYQPNVYNEEDQDILLHVASQATVAIEHARLYHAAQRRVRELDALQKVSVELVSSLDLAAALNLVVSTALDLTHASDAHIFLYDEATGRLTFGASLWSTGETGLREETTPRPDGITMASIKTRQPIVIDDCETHPLFSDPKQRQWGLDSIASFPLLRAHLVLGALNIAFLEPHIFDDDELRLLRLLADQAAIAIDNARLYKEARDRAERLAVVEEIAKAITSTFELQEIMSAASQSLLPLVPHAHMCLSQYDFEEASLTVIGTLGMEVSGLRKSLETGFSEAVLEQALRQQCAAVVPDTSQSPGLVAQTLAAAGVRSLAVIPVVAESLCIGLWTVGAREAGAFTSTHLELLSQVSGHLAIAIKNAWLYAEVEDALDRLKDSQLQLVRSERMRALAELSAGVAHDFNNVLTSILGRVQLMLLEVHDPALRDSLQVIERAARNGARTVRRIMGFARHREGEPLVPLDVNRLVEDAILLTEPRWSAPVSDGPMIDVKFRRGRVQPVMGSAAEISEVLTNLIFNAVDAMPQGGRIVLETREQGGEAVIRVQDTGSGIPQELMGRLFAPFFTTKGGSNAGMGLSVASEIVARHKGNIDVESKVGQGSVFSVRLPIARNVRAQKPEEELGMREPVRRQRSLSILVVEDEESIRRLLSSILGLEGHEVRTFSHALDGIAAFRDAPADLVITDLGLPDQSGWEVARQVKTVSPDTPVILITGWGVSAEVTEARRRGVDYILPKPFEFEELSELITRALTDLEE